MKKRFVITNTPIKFPVNSTILYSFLLYHFNVSGIWWGIFITLYSIYWILAFVIAWNEVKIDLNDDKSSIKNEVKKSLFAQRLEKIINDRKQND